MKQKLLVFYGPQPKMGKDFKSDYPIKYKENISSHNRTGSCTLHTAQFHTRVFWLIETRNVNKYRHKGNVQKAILMFNCKTVKLIVFISIWPS